MVFQTLIWRQTLLCKICRLCPQRQSRLPKGEGQYRSKLAVFWFDESWSEGQWCHKQSFIVQYIIVQCNMNRSVWSDWTCDIVHRAANRVSHQDIIALIHHYIKSSLHKDNITMSDNKTITIKVRVDSQTLAAMQSRPTYTPKAISAHLYVVHPSVITRRRPPLETILNCRRCLTPQSSRLAG